MQACIPHPRRSARHATNAQQVVDEGADVVPRDRHDFLRHVVGEQEGVELGQRLLVVLDRRVRSIGGKQVRFPRDPEAHDRRTLDRHTCECAAACHRWSFLADAALF